MYYTKFLSKIIFVLSICIVLSCSPSEKLRTIDLKVNEDSTFIFEKYHDHYFIRIQLQGEIDSDCSIEIGQHDQVIKTLHYPISTIALKKGFIDDTLSSEIYSNKAQVKFIHKKAKNGNLKMIIDF